MKKSIIIITGAAMAVILSGCNATTFSVHKQDGTTVSVTNYRLLWQTGSYTATLGTNSASLTANNSQTDDAALQAVAQGVAQGITTGVPK